MTTPTGTITLQDVEDEFGGTGSISISEYYAGGGLVQTNHPGIPASGQISMSDLQGKTQVNVSITPTSVNSFCNNSAGFTCAVNSTAATAIVVEAVGAITYLWEIITASASVTVFGNLTSSTLRLRSDASVPSAAIATARVAISTGGITRTSPDIVTFNFNHESNL